MTRDRIRGFCPRCRHQQIFERTEVHHGLHLFLSVVTCGLWLVSWLSFYIGNRMHPWRCVQCNWNRPVFDAAQNPEGSSERDRGDGSSSSDSMSVT